MKINRDTPLFIPKNKSSMLTKKLPRRIINLAKRLLFFNQSQNKGDGNKKGETLDNVLHRNLQNLRLMLYKLIIYYPQIKYKWSTHYMCSK